MTQGKIAATIKSPIIMRIVNRTMSAATTLTSHLVFTSKVGLSLAQKVAHYQKMSTPGSFGEAQQGVANFFTTFQTGAWKKVTVKESVYLASQIATVGGFFFIGEAIGRGNLLGYDIG